MNVELTGLFRRVRSLRDPEKIPGALQRGTQMCIEKGNNLGIPKEDFVSLCHDLAREMAEECCPGFTAPIDVKGANLLVTINSKEPFAEPDDMKLWWKIFHAAGESWTIPSEYWDGVNWGYFTGDDESMKTIVGRLVENMRRLECRTLLLPACGHAYYATRYGLQKWFREKAAGFEVLSIFDLLVRYLTDGRIRIDPALHPDLAVYSDSCNYGRNSLKAFGHGYFEEGRWITRQCCPSTIDMYPDREGNYCCGAGGGAWAMPFTEERVFHGRFKARQIQRTGAKLVITPCYNCRDQIVKSLSREYNLDIRVKYLWELVADSIILPGKSSGAGSDPAYGANDGENA